MKWISKHPPIYVCKGDMWYCEEDKLTYTANVKNLQWKCGNWVRPFPNKCHIFD